MKIKELRNMNKGELGKLLDEKKSRVLQMRFDIASKQVKNHREIRNARKDVARIQTLMKSIAE
jgi:large subunit ribosomal protein L29